MLIRSCCISHRDFNLHMTWQRRCIVSVIALFCVTCSMRANESCLSSIHFTNGATSAPLPGVIRNEKSHVFISARIIGHDEELRFVFDTGAEDAVNHPVIRQSKGPLRETNTGAGGVGQSLRGVVGPNEWSRIGSTTIPATKSACCAGNDDVNRQLGSAILSHFRIMFNYPARQIILEKN